MKNIKNIVNYCLFFAVALIAHFLIYRNNEILSTLNFNNVYLFVSIVFLVSMLMLLEANVFLHKHLGFVFIVIVTLKLAAAYFFITAHEDAIDQNIYKYSFVVLYLISLVLLTIFAARLLLAPEK